MVNDRANHRVKNKVKATHKPPARVRYEQGHPNVTCMLDRDTHTLLKQRLEDLGGVSFSDFVKDSLGLLQLKMPDVEEIKDIAAGEGYTQATKDYQIWYFCAVCRQRIDMSPNSKYHEAMTDFMREHGWGHASCHGH